MRAMILAAGLGKRLRPLTDTTPKPLLRAGSKTLIEYHLERLARLGVREVIVNTHWLGEQVSAALGDGKRWGLSLRYSPETTLLETAGGIRHAQPWQNDDEVFLLVNGDVYFEHDLEDFLTLADHVDGQRCNALLALVPNPEEHPAGDFVAATGRGAVHVIEASATQQRPGQTYAGIALLHAGLFDSVTPSKPAPLAPLLRAALARGTLFGWDLPGFWLDVGTPARLAALRQRLGDATGGF